MSVLAPVTLMPCLTEIVLITEGKSSFFAAKLRELPKDDAHNSQLYHFNEK
jgi:hypothetical protein